MSTPRFAFGANWSRYLSLITEERIQLASLSLAGMLKSTSLVGRSFLDVGSGSGLFSLAARRLGARVLSFDYDEASVACTAELRRRYSPNDPDWHVERGSVLNQEYMQSVGSHDVIYSWGVLHHTGAMWRAIDLAMLPLAPHGTFYIAIYNRLSPLHHRLVLGLKRTYVKSGRPLRAMLLSSYFAYASSLEVLAAVYHRQHPLSRIRAYAKRSRGMSWWHDIVDWVGGYPYESATPAEIVTFCESRGLRLSHWDLGVGHACNEFVFTRALNDRPIGAGSPQG